jgi:hypothetical protein
MRGLSLSGLRTDPSVADLRKFAGRASGMRTEVARPMVSGTLVDFRVKVILEYLCFSVWLGDLDF